jgi:hypothetical protein
MGFGSCRSKDQTSICKSIRQSPQGFGGLGTFLRPTFRRRFDQVLPIKVLLGIEMEKLLNNRVRGENKHWDKQN